MRVPLIISQSYKAAPVRARVHRDTGRRATGVSLTILDVLLENESHGPGYRANGISGGLGPALLGIVQSLSKQLFSLDRKRGPVIRFSEIILF